MLSRVKFSLMSTLFFSVSLQKWWKLLSKLDWQITSWKLISIRPFNIKQQYVSKTETILALESSAVKYSGSITGNLNPILWWGKKLKKEKNRASFHFALFVTFARISELSKKIKTKASVYLLLMRKYTWNFSNSPTFIRRMELVRLPKLTIQLTFNIDLVIYTHACICKRAHILASVS